MTIRLGEMHRWNGLMLTAIVVGVMNFATAGELGRADEPWPPLLDAGSARSEPAVTALLQRANDSLERLIEADRPLVQPL